MATEYYYEGPVQYLCEGCGKKTRKSSFDRISNVSMKVNLDSDGYFRCRRGYCTECSKRITKGMGRVVKAIVIFFVVGAILSFGSLILYNLFGGGLHEYTYDKVLKECQSHPDIMNDVSNKNGVGTTTFEIMKKNLSDGDYFMYIYGEGRAEVQKDTTDGKSTYIWRFKKGYGELSKRTYILENEILYELGKEKIAYHSTAAEYEPLLKKLQAYLPENYCGKGDYTSESRLDDADTLLTANIVYGDGVTCLYHSTLDSETFEETAYYYEKSDEVFLRLSIDEYGDNDAIKTAPKLSDCKEIK